MNKPRRFMGEAAFVTHRRTSKRTEGPGFTSFVLPSTDGHWYFAAVASKRLGGAVERNRAKRRLRVAFAAAAKDVLKPLRVILYAKNAALKNEFQGLIESLHKILV